MKFLEANRIAPDGTRRHIWGYTVCLCHTKRTPGLYELILTTSLGLPGVTLFQIFSNLYSEEKGKKHEKLSVFWDF